jgi:hypothetical protein
MRSRGTRPDDAGETLCHGTDDGGTTHLCRWAEVAAWEGRVLTKRTECEDDSSPSLNVRMTRDDVTCLGCLAAPDRKEREVW